MYSLLDGYATPKEYMEQAKKIGLKALAITEHGSEYSWCYFDKLKKDYPNIKVIFGVELYECFDINVKDKDSKYFHLIALAKNENGRKALNNLVTMSNLEGFYYKPRVTIDQIAPYANDLIICSACLASKLARESDYNKCIDYVNEYKSKFPNYYLEMQSHKHPDQALYNQKILSLSQDTNTLYIITTDSHAATKEDLYYQGRHVQIAHDTETSSELYEGCYVQTEEEIHECMDSQIGIEAVNLGLSNTNIIADIIEDVCMPFQSPKLPTFPLPNGFTNNKDYLKYLVEQGWNTRKFNELSTELQQKYRERIDYELDIIHQMGFDGYFLIVWDFINYAKTHNVKVGAGRGSCAGSQVCYTIGITDIDPIKYGLIFERFLNPERVSLPDSDTDVSDRATVINYLINKYGSNRVCQILNFSYITPVVAIKDVGKILKFPYGEMDKLSKRFTYETFQKCIDNNTDFLQENPQYQELIDIASHLSGRVKTVSMHAGGVGIVDTDINDYMAMKLGTKGEHVIQVDKHIVEDIGIVKFDILGVATLSLVQEIQQDLNISDFELSANNPDFITDKAAYELLSKATTNGVFQVESAGMKDLLLRLQPSDLGDISAVLALYRPDSMGALEDYIYYKHHPTEVTYIHDDMKPILSETYGQMIYQEELMDIVRKFGGRSYGGADKFRKGIGKKDKQLVQDEANKLYSEIVSTGYSINLATTISEDMKTKGGYLFNKSHSYSYAVLTLQTAYLKAHYPEYFFKALFNLNKDKAGMINKYIIDAKSFNVSILPPHINRSEMNFSVYNKQILFGLSAIKGIGESFAKVILDNRAKKFESLSDFISRVNPNKTQTISLIKSGAIPTKDKKQMLIKYFMSQYSNTEFKPISSIPSPYSKLLEYDLNVDDYRVGKKVDKDRLLADYNKAKKAQFEKTANEKLKMYQTECNEKYLQQESFWEFEALQIFINDNPFDKAYEYLPSFDDIEVGDKCTIVGVIAKVSKKKDKNGKQFAYINIYSSFGLVEGIVWHSTLKEFEDIIRTGSQVALLVKKDGDEKVMVDKIKPYNVWLEQINKKGVFKS